MEFIVSRWLSACGKGDWPRRWKLTGDSGAMFTSWLLMLCGIGIPAGKVSHPIPLHHLSLGKKAALGIVGMEKVTLLAGILCTAPLERHIPTPGVSKCRCHCILLAVSRTCDLLFCSEDAPLTLQPAQKSVQAVYFSSWGVSWTSMQYSKFEHVSSDQAVRLGTGCIFWGSLTILIPQGIPYALSTCTCGREEKLPIFKGKLPGRYEWK